VGLPDLAVAQLQLGPDVRQLAIIEGPVDVGDLELVVL